MHKWNETNLWNRMDWTSNLSVHHHIFKTIVCKVSYSLIRKKTNTSSASKLMKLAIAKPSMTSSSQDTDSLFLRRGGLCLPNPGRHSLPPGPRTLLVPHASRSEPEDRDVARSPARSTLLLRRSLSRWERDLRLCLNPVVRLGPSMLKRDFLV